MTTKPDDAKPGLAETLGTLAKEPAFQRAMGVKPSLAERIEALVLYLEKQPPDMEKAQVRISLRAIAAELREIAARMIATSEEYDTRHHAPGEAQAMKRWADRIAGKGGT